MPKYAVYMQLTPKRVGKDEQGNDEFEARLQYMCRIIAKDGAAAIAEARRVCLPFRLGFQKSSLHSRPIVEEV